MPRCSHGLWRVHTAWPGLTLRGFLPKGTRLWPVGPGLSVGTEGRAKVSQPQRTQDHSSSRHVFSGRDKSSDEKKARIVSESPTRVWVSGPPTPWALWSCILSVWTSPPPPTRGLPLHAVPPPVPLLVPVAPREEPLALTPGNALTSVWQVPTFVSWGLSVGVAEVIWLNVTLFLPSNVFVDHPGLVSCRSRGVCLPKGCAPFPAQKQLVLVPCVFLPLPRHE